jgi:hypothetical protein
MVEIGSIYNKLISVIHSCKCLQHIKVTRKLIRQFLKFTNNKILFNDLINQLSVKENEI